MAPGNYRTFKRLIKLIIYLTNLNNKSSYQKYSLYGFNSLRIYNTSIQQIKHMQFVKAGQNEIIKTNGFI